MAQPNWRCLMKTSRGHTGSGLRVKEREGCFRVERRRVEIRNIEVCREESTLPVPCGLSLCSYRYIASEIVLMGPPLHHG